MRPVKKGSVDVSVVVRIVDSGDGTPETGVEHNTTGIDLWYRREGAASVDITEVALSTLTDAHSDGGIEHINDGYYRLDLPDAAVATGANGVMVGGTVTGMVVIGCYVHLTDYDPQDGVRLGLTALPNAAADAAGGLPISDAGGLDLDAKIGALTFGTANRVNAQVYGMEVNAVTADAIANGAIDAATFAADVDAEILSYLVDDATRIDASALNTATGTTIPAILDDTGTSGVVVASGSKTGYSLAAAGMDLVVIETGLNARQALSIIASSSAGVLAGAAGTSVTIAAAGVPATNRITATVDSSGNRTAVTLNAPA